MQVECIRPSTGTQQSELCRTPHLHESNKLVTLSAGGLYSSMLSILWVLMLRDLSGQVLQSPNTRLN